MTEPWIQTAGGRAFDLDAPSPDAIDIEDIAHALAHLCRFNGHTSRFYSVAQHSVLVSQIVPRELSLAGLLHDAAEAYLGDVTRPLKQLLPDYQAIEARVERVIFDIYGLAYPVHPEVCRADAIALAIEQRDVMGASPRDWDLPEPIPGLWPRLIALDPDEAREAFLERAAALGIYDDGSLR